MPLDVGGGSLDLSGRLLQIGGRMFQKILFLFCFSVSALLLGIAETHAASIDQGAPGYRLPPAPIPEILDTPPTPAVSISPGRTTMALLEREGLPPVERLAEPELRLAGARINPHTNGPSRAVFYTGVEFQSIAGGERIPVSLPENPRISYVQWAPDGPFLAFGNTTDEGIELWVAHSETGEIRRLLGPAMNATMDRPYDWSPDGKSLLVRRVPPERGNPPVAPHVASGPSIQDSTGVASPARTYQDVLNNAHDEALFEHYFTSQMVRVWFRSGEIDRIGAPGIFRSVSTSPDSEYILVYRIKRPYSYIAPMHTFARELAVVDGSGNPVYTIDDRTAVVLPPIGRDMVSPGPRWVTWRNDAPATLLWVEALDDGNARDEAEFRDRLFLLDAPFEAEPRVLLDLDQRLSGVHWGRDDLALIHSRWRTTSRTKTYAIAPSDPGGEARLFWERSFEDRYGDPGSPVTTRGDDGYPLLRFSPDGEFIYFSGEGASPQGSYPFIDRLHLPTVAFERLWQAEDPYYETLTAILDDEANEFISRRESREDPPNYFFRNRVNGTVRTLTGFPDPAPQLAGIQREIITYLRDDGIPLSATLFTPPGYDPERDGPLPIVLWAYPREFRDADAAGQVTTSPNRFSRPFGTSPLFLLTQGYALLSGPAMPIIGEGDDEPNDTYIEQLVASAEAAVRKAVEMGVADPQRVAIAGHSYGAFMAANLLAHSDLFRAGIARSGAYNRSLTPFGFQAEPRSYWEARDVYLQMSPFSYADRITAPILLIHGAEDNNSGTYPMQSERMFQALKGHGAVTRLVMMPHESHGYAARESVLHVLAETIEWLDRYLKE